MGPRSSPQRLCRMTSFCDSTDPEKELSAFPHWQPSAPRASKGVSHAYSGPCAPGLRSNSASPLPQFPPTPDNRELQDTCQAPNHDLKKCMPSPQMGKK